jgi:hypothetical protein
MRERDDIGLGVAAIDAKRVQLHDFARVILVDAGQIAARARAARRGVELVVEIDQHRRRARGRQQQIAKMTERIRPDDVFVVPADPEMVEPLAGENVEMIEPEIDHDLLQLARAVKRAPDTGILGLLNDDLRALAPRLLLFGGRFDAAVDDRKDRTVLNEKLRRIELQRIETGQPIGQRGRLRDHLGMQLLVDIAFDADLFDMIDIGLRWAEGHPVEDVDDVFIRGRVGECRAGHHKRDADSGEEAEGSFRHATHA